MVPHCHPEYTKEWWETFRRAEVEAILDMTANKNNDYTGGKGCDNPFANFDKSVEFGVHPLTGICVRMQDKFQRARALCSDGSLSVTSKGDQSKDIFRDLIGYSLIAIGMLDREEPK
jgi:hypothetical protein|tara:strand:+ start:556 stop:906 length:351 start_codon:yes stop_codon:yes gene_type:complete